MKRLIDIFEGNLVFSFYFVREKIPHEWLVWDNMLGDVFKYLQDNLDAEKYADVEKYLSTAAEEISKDFKPIYVDDEKGRRHLVEDFEELNKPLFPKMQEVLEYIDSIMWQTIKDCNIPFIHGCYVESGFLLEKLISMDKKIVIPGYCIQINNRALRLCPNIEELVIEEGVKFIHSVFDEKNRNNLKRLVLPSSIKAIESSAFSNCENLREIIFCGDIPISSKTFENTIWMDCFNLKNLGQSMRIEAGSLIEFIDIDKEKTLVIPEGVRFIGEYALQYGTFETIVLPKSIEDIGMGAFNDCENLRRITIPDKVQYICKCFDGCEALEEVYLSENVRVVVPSETFGVSGKITVFGHRNNETMQYLVKQAYINFEFVD